MPLYSREQIDDLLFRCDIVELISKQITLKKQGANYSACCPFHQEKTPSFSVSPTKQFYYCFGCQASGNAISFLMDYQKLTFPESIEALAKFTGTPLPDKADSNNHSTPPPKINKTLTDTLTNAPTFFRQALKSPEAKRARHYLHTRGIDAGWAETYGLGFSYPDWDRLLNHITQDRIKAGLEAGLIIEKSPERHYDRFRNRLMFPIRDRKGQVVGFGGRILNNEQPKYLNSPETPVFQKQKLLYGLFEALKQSNKPEAFIVVEGYMDVIALAQAGFTNTVATLGTSTSEYHVQHLFRHSNKLIFCFDGDNAGQKAAERALFNTLPHMQEGREAQFVFLPQGEDPDSIVRREGSNAFEDRLNNALPLSQQLQNLLAEGINLLTLDGRASFLKRAQPAIERIPNNLYRQLLVESLAQFAQVQPQLLTNPTHQNQPRHQPQHQPQNQHHPSATFNKPYKASNKGQYSHQKKSPTPWKNKSYPPTQEPHLPQPETPKKLVDQIITMLIKNPKISQELTLPSSVKEANLPHFSLLSELQKLFQDTPDASLAYLLGHWHLREEGQQLASLAAQEYLLPEAPQTQELTDALEQLEKLAIDLLLAQAVQQKPPDQHRIRDLIAQKAALSQKAALTSE